MCDSQNSGKFYLCNIFRALIIILCLFKLYDHYKITSSTTRRLVHTRDPKFSLLGPYNNTNYEINDVYNQLIDIKNFTFKVNPQPCSDYENGLLLIVIVSSRPDNFKHRKIIRATWGHSIDSMKVVFLLGESPDQTISKGVENESLTYGDIVQGSFIDAYRNMTYKHVMGLKWVTHHCPTAKYILKTDDDVMVNSHELRQFLARELSPWGARDLITCKVLAHKPVLRTKPSKWYVTEMEYSGKHYPDYCSGMTIIYSQDVVRRILSVAQDIPFFWIDDVHITGTIAEKLGIARTPLASLVLSDDRFNTLDTRGLEHVGQFLFGPPDLTTDEVWVGWVATH